MQAPGRYEVLLSKTIRSRGSSAWELSAPLSFPYEIKHLHCLKLKLPPNDGPMQIAICVPERKGWFPAQRAGRCRRPGDGSPPCSLPAQSRVLAGGIPVLQEWRSKGPCLSPWRQLPGAVMGQEGVWVLAAPVPHVGQLRGAAA